ncbi:MAG: tetratricopeptide repeat protein, partial [Desulfobacteraceae bacterium]
ANMLWGALKILERDPEGAEEAFRKVIDMRPDYAPAYLRLGLLCSMTGRGEEALEHLEKALGLDPSQTTALGIMVADAIRKKEYERALEIVEGHRGKVGENPRVEGFLDYTAARVFVAKGEREKAEELLKSSIAKNPNMAAAYPMLSAIYASEGRLDEAKVQYEALLEKKPAYLPGYMALGSILEHEGKGEEAEAYYRKALEKKEDFAPAANNLAWRIAESGGNIDEALKFAQIAKRNAPESPGVMDTLGWIYYLKERYPSAISELEDALQLAPEHPVILYHAGMAYYKDGQKEKARERLEKALEIDPDFEGAEEARETLDAIRGG